MSAIYIKYNHALNALFFSGRFAWQPVYLSLDASMRAELAATLDEDEEGLEEKICEVAGNVLDRLGNPYAAMNDQAKVWWRKSRLSPPPFTALLFALSHAAAQMAADGNFGPNNYYLRLAQAIGRERQLLSFHGKYTDSLWELLSQWLTENNYELGRPTAAAINSWKYVGKALSQVVVRAGDRELFHDMFTRYGFSGNESISPDEIRHYLANWMLTSKPNRRLKAAWKKAELQQRVSEAAIAELAIWGSTAGIPANGAATNAAKRSVKLSLIASFVTRFPRPTMMDLQIGRSEERSEPLQPLAIDEAPGQGFALANEDFGTFATILPRPIGADGRTLSRSYSFAAPGDIHLDWQPRIVIPLAKANDGPYWIEVTRVTFGQPHLILVRNIVGFPKKVEAYLSDAALEMPTKVMPQDLPGLPSDWILYKDARLGQPSSTPPLDLQALVPIGDEGALTVEGSIQLARGIFHSRSELIASALVPRGPTELLVFPLGASSGQVIKGMQEVGNACRLKIAGREAKGHAGLRLEGRSGAEVVASVEILLRDADTPRALDRQGRDALSYHNPISAAGSSQGNAQLGPLSVAGMVVVGIEDDDDDNAAITLGNQLPQGETEEAQDATLASPILKHIANQTCAERGYHIWLCEPLEPGRPNKTPLRQECKDCAQAIIIIDRGKKTAQVKPVGLRPMKFYTGIDSPSLPLIDHNLLFDALCFLGTGSWGKFETLLADRVEMPWQAREIAQNYALLGLLDLELRPGTNLVQRWSVPPCAASFIDEDTALLSGFRSQSLFTSLSATIRRAGGHVTEAPRTSVPGQIEITGLAPTRLSEVLAAIADPLGRPVSVNREPGQKIASACLEWGNLDACLVPISIGRPANLQSFNVKTARWEKVFSTASKGAYRWNDGIQTYAFIDDAGKSFAGQHQVVKLLAARAQRYQLHAYDATRRVFLATLGCDAPGLLGRALVACSGSLPEISDGLLKYSNVAPHTARQVLDAMYKKEEARDEARYAYQRY